jgi:hypothetical protein
MVWVTACTAPWPRITPSTTPSAAPNVPTSSASLSTSRKTSRRVTPRQRSVPNSGRRCTTEKVMVL